MERAKDRGRQAKAGPAILCLLSSALGALCAAGENAGAAAAGPSSKKNPRGYCHLPASLFEFARKAAGGFPAADK